MKWFVWILTPTLFFGSVQYNVVFNGVEEKIVEVALEKSSELVLLKNRFPPSVRALEYRVQSDLPKLYQVLHAFGYYDAAIYPEIEQDTHPVTVRLLIYPGMRYKIGLFKLQYLHDVEKPALLMQDIGLKKGDFVDAKTVLLSPKKLLRFLADRNYPLAQVQKENYSIDRKKKTIHGTIVVDSGPKTRFGPLLITGLKSVKTDYVVRKMQFQEGDLYDENLVEASQKRLIDTQLFSSVLFTHGEELDEEGELPIKLQIAESKHKNIGIGVSYATIDGPGASIGWQNRNIAGEGHILAFDLDVAKTYSVGSLSYKVPDFFHKNQSYLARAEMAREDITVYLARTYTLLQRIEREWQNHFFLSIGLGASHIDVNKSIANNHFSLVSAPFSFRYRNVDNLLNTTKGMIIIYKFAPYTAVAPTHTTFCKQLMTINTYFPLMENRFLVFAIRSQVGSIAGSSLNRIPFTKRFLGGSDENLRGYRYKTVSPLNKEGDPTGGRSAIYNSLEMRMRLTETIGVVPFFDIGKVGDAAFPDMRGKWLKSVGVGLRYFLFFGPLRLDVGFPLNKRPFDDTYKIYISIGQTF